MQGLPVMDSEDAVVTQYAKKLADRTALKMFSQYRKVTSIEFSAFYRLIFNCHFILLNQISEVILDCDKSAAEEAQCPLDQKYHKVLLNVFFDEPRLYRVMHQAEYPDLPDWDNLTTDQKSELRKMYRDLTKVTWCALMYWTGGYIDRKRVKILEQLL